MPMSEPDVIGPNQSSSPKTKTKNKAALSFRPALNFLVGQLLEAETNRHSLDKNSKQKTLKKHSVGFVF